MFDRLAGRLLIFACTFGMAHQAHAASPQAVEDSIKRGRDWLLAQQTNAGDWESPKQAAPKPGDEIANNNDGGQYYGRTAMAVYTLLATGVPHSDEHIKKAVEYLKKAEPTGTYALAMRCQVWLSLPDTPEIRALMKKDAASLLASMRMKGSAHGMWDYSRVGTSYSHSRSQYAVLGLWAAAQRGVEIRADEWKTIENAWLEHQDPSGGWSYKAKGESEHAPTAGMTAPGIATLYIVQEMLYPNQGIECRGNTPNPAIEKGLKWLEGNFVEQVAPAKLYPRAFPYATLYAIERVGVASGLKYIGGKDWYDYGADYLLKWQEKKEGNWNLGSGNGMYTGAPDTCFALLFLSRGRAPIAMSKLEYGIGDKPANWNQRPRDAANLTRWLAKSAERELNWQVTNLRNSPANELNDAPILYIAGNQKLEFSAEEKEKLRSFVLNGGLLLANADCGSVAFANTIQTLGAELFPPYEFRELEQDHVIFTGQNFARTRWKNPPTVRALGNGAREFIILIPQADTARAWQLKTILGREALHELAGDVFQYAVERRILRNRGESTLILPDAKAPKPNRTAKLARIEYAGNWNPEPGGWARLANHLANTQAAALEVTPIKLGEGKLDASFPMAHLTGTLKLALGDAQKDELKKYVAGGGMLVIDSCGGGAGFAGDAEALASVLCDGAKPTAISEADPVVVGPVKLEAIEYRAFASRVGALRGLRLKAYALPNRKSPAVILSAEDLSVGLVGQPVDGINGYRPTTVLPLVTNIVLNTAFAPAAARNNPNGQ